METLYAEAPEAPETEAASDIIVEVDPAEQIPPELEAFEHIIEPEPSTEWAEANPDGTVSEETFLQRLRWHIGQAGHALDTVVENITSDKDAKEWLELKARVAELKTSIEPYGDFSVIDRLLEDTEAFVETVGFDESLQRSCQ